MSDVKIKSRGGKELSGCQECVIRVDQNGNLWFKDKDGAVLYLYDPIKEKVILETKNYIKIIHVAFKNGKVYGLGDKKIGGIYVLN